MVILLASIKPVSYGAIGNPYVKTALFLLRQMVVMHIDCMAYLVGNGITDE
ncbi:hypothetical protein [Mucilaginibacter gilvus]|uniref:hypothetical protein n=1 Tax=Mucilaginibacter gilvus TaxID=2305909 RepID=UPI001419C470|nr:hypothetical protein [Mucilaginibacter gilvus]